MVSCTLAARVERPLKLRVRRGRPLPYGCSEAGAGQLNFSLLAPDVESAWLVLEVPSGAQGNEDERRQLVPLRLLAAQHRTGPIWHAEVPAAALGAGLRYGWLLDPPLGADARPLASAPVIVDPCARVLDSPSAAKWNGRGGPKYSPMAVIPDFRTIAAFDWEGVTAPGLLLKDLIIYEAHVRGFTRHPDSGVGRWESNAGTFLGFIEKIPHLLSLGVNCVELLPSFEFDETACPRVHPETKAPLCNYWGYSTAAFFVPMQRFAASAQAELSTAIVEFRTMVRELHRYGIEVVLDVVFNHTGEGAWGESNWHSLSKIAESHYYLMSNGYHTNYTGCGNTINANDPICAEWICECLRYWALDMGVDGFRFDLAAALARGAGGEVLEEPPFIRRLVQDPLLQHLKLIAEPWDCSWPDGYLVGRFPSCGPPRIAEWNGKFRDAARRFLKGDAGMKGEFATRVCGSADLYEAGGRGPCHSVNFVTAHDGFTLRDLVSYTGKHNDGNAEESGDDNNMSWNCGAEGPTDEPAVLALRERQLRNFTAALLLSAGTPMLTSGDEYGRTLGGNNNTWCQDELSWFSWGACAAEEAGLVRFCRLVASLRKRHGVFFARTGFVSDRDISWNHGDWEDTYNFLSFVLHHRTPVESKLESAGDASPGGASPAAGGLSAAEPETRHMGLLVAFNAGHLPQACRLPGAGPWRRLVDTNLAPPFDICESDEEAQPISGDSYLMTPYSCIVLKTYEDTADAFTYGSLELEGGQAQRLREELRLVALRGAAQEEASETSVGDADEVLDSTLAGA